MLSSMAVATVESYCASPTFMMNHPAFENAPYGPRPMGYSDSGTPPK